LAGCSYPIWFALDRANLEVWAFGGTALWAYSYQRGYRPAANFALAVTLNLKPFPIVFCALYAARGTWKDLFYGALAGAVIFGFCMALLPGSVADNMRRLAVNLDLYNKVYIERGEGMPFAHSLFGLLKMIAATKTPGGPFAYNAAGLMMPYLVLSLAAMVWLTIYLTRVAQPWWAQLALLVSAMNLLPFFSADYKLLHVFLPLFAWINAPPAMPPQMLAGRSLYPGGAQFDKIIAVLFALLLMPKNIGHPWNDEISLGSILNPLLMLLLCVLVIRPSWSSKAHPLFSTTKEKPFL
jgi:hypothetical protein